MQAIIQPFHVYESQSMEGTLEEGPTHMIIGLLYVQLDCHKTMTIRDPLKIMHKFLDNANKSMLEKSNKVTQVSSFLP